MQTEMENAAAVEEISESSQNAVIKLDYSLEDPEERVKLVEKIIKNTPSSKLTNRYLEILANYLIFSMNKKEKK